MKKYYQSIWLSLEHDSPDGSIPEVTTDEVIKKVIAYLKTQGIRARALDENAKA